MMAPQRTAPGSRPLVLVRPGDAPPDDRALVERLKAGNAEAAGELFDRYGRLVNTVLYRILGGGSEHDDRVQETFIEAVRSIRSLRDDGALRAWMTTLAARVARAELRRRKVRRFLSLAEEELPDVASYDDHAARDALVATFKILDAMPIDERLAFTLRFVHGEELVVVAEACGCSLATVKRWLARAEARFVAQCQKHPELARRLQEGGRWSAQ